MTIAWQDSLRILDELEEQEAKLLGWGVAEVAHTSKEVEDVVRALLPGVSPSEGVAGLVGHGLLLQTADGRYRTRTAETVRLASSLRQWFGSGPYGKVAAGDIDPANPSRKLADLGDLASWEGTKRLVSDFRFRSDPRRVPRRHRTREEVLRALESRGARDLTPFLEVLLPDSISQFQEDSLQTIAGWRGRKRDSAAIVTAGTGAGKTYAFYLPVLATLAAGSAPRDCPSVLAIYPRIELLKDQLRVAFDLCRSLDRAAARSGRSQLSVGALFADVPWGPDDVERKKIGRGGWKKSGNDHICPFLSCPKPGCGGDLLWGANDRRDDVQRLKCAKCDYRTEQGQIVLTRQRLEKSPPDVLFISMEMLNLSLQKRGMTKVIGGRSATPRYVLLDEVHTYGGLTGAQNAYVLRRWRSRVYQADVPVAWVGLSATLERPVDFFQQMVPIHPSAPIDHLEPAEGEMEELGKKYSLILKGNPFSQAALLAVTIQSLMLLARTCTDPRDAKGRSKAFGHKSFAFTDTLDVFSRLEGDLRDAESKQLPWLRSSHPDEEDVARSRRMDAGQHWGAAEAAGWRLSQPLDVRSLSSKWRDDLDGADVVVATSSLEVGYDDDEVNLVLQHKAPRDWASYLQRIGRAGRKTNMRPWAVTVLSDYGRDGIAFQNYHEFYQPALRYRPVPMDNAYVLRIQAAFAILDVLADKAGASGLTWQLGQWLHADSRGPAPALRDKVLSMIDAWLEDPKGLKDHLMWRLRWPEEALLDSAMYQPPRSLMYEFLPVLARLFRGVGTREEATDAGALAYFLPRALFESLELPEVEVRLGEATDSEQPMPAERLLSEFAPLKVSKRFSRKGDRSPGHWIAPADLGERLKEASEVHGMLDGPLPLALRLDEIGQFVEDHRWEDGAGPIRLHRPVCVHLREQGEFSERSNAFMNWQTRIEAPDERVLQSVALPLQSPISHWVHSLKFALHTHGAPVSLMRYAESARAELQHSRSKSLRKYGLFEGQQVRVHFEGPAHGSRTAIGFRHQVDGLAIRVPEDALASIRSALSEAILPSQRSDFFREQFQTRWSGRVDGEQGLNKFQLDRLSGLFLAELSCQMIRRGKPVIHRVDRWRKKPERFIKDLVSAARILYQTPDLEQDALVETEVSLGLERMIGSETLRASLLDLSAVLHEDAGGADWFEDFVAWSERRALAGLGSTFLDAVQALLPDLDLDSLQIDQQFVHRDGVRSAEVWITEATPGGIGNVLQIREVCHTREDEFYWAWTESIRPGHRESLTANLRQVGAELALCESPIAEAASSYRSAAGIEAVQAAVKGLRASLADHGIPPRYELMSALFNRVLSSGSNPELDRLTHQASRVVEEADQELPFEGPSEAIRLIVGFDPEERLLPALRGAHPWSDEWKRLAADASGEVARAWKAQRLGALIWPRDRERVQQEVGGYNRFEPDRRMDLSLVRMGMGAAPVVFIPPDSEVDDWWPGLEVALQGSPAEVHLRVGPTNRSVLAEAVRRMVTQSMDNDVTSGFVHLAAIRRDAEGWFAVLQMQELVR